MSAGIAAAAIGAATSIGTGIASASAGKKASSKSAKAAHEQNVLLMKMLNSGREEANQALDPYAQLGDAAQQQLRYELGLGGTGTGEAGSLSTKYGMDQYKDDPGYTPMVNSLEELQQTPGYQFQLEQGLQGVNNSAAAKGSLLSGKQLKGINNYAQGVASQGYQSAWERAQQAYQSAFTRNQSQNQQRFNQLYAPTSLGFNAANQQGQNTQSAFNNIGNVVTGNQATQTQANMYQADQTQSSLSNANRSMQDLLASAQPSDSWDNNRVKKTTSGWW
jgi:hypothetical protein